MFSTFLQELRGYMGKGYLLGVFVPTLIIASLGLVVGVEITVGTAEMLQRWSALDLDAQLILGFGALIAVAFWAYLIHNLQIAITRMLEGYWQGTLLDPLYRLRQRRYQAVYDQLDSQRSALERALSADGEQPDPAIMQQAARLLSYWSRMQPPHGHRERVQPTRLGNILRAGELYAEDHYGIDAVVIWPRMRPLLPTAFVSVLLDRKIAMDALLLMTLYSGGISLIFCPIIALFSTRWDLFLLCALGLPLASVCYRSALQSAIAYSEQIRTAFDLYRTDLLKTLGLKIPVDSAQERALWAALSRFYQNNIPLALATNYQPAVKAEEAYRYLLPPDGTDGQGTSPRAPGDRPI